MAYLAVVLCSTVFPLPKARMVISLQYGDTSELHLQLLHGCLWIFARNCQVVLEGMKMEDFSMLYIRFLPISTLLEAEHRTSLLRYAGKTFE